MCLTFHAEWRQPFWRRDGKCRRGLLEVLVFAVVDPHHLRWLGVGALDWPAAAVYTIAFFVFWAVTTVTAALALMLDLPAERINRL